ncbi:MAG: hypothetical protein J6M43_01195 [Neisseriaceae bacterium]|nr:hypothetical protein [Neisseriaceae bacterium]
MKKLYTTLLYLLCVTPAVALDAQDEGYFVLKNVKTGETATTMHFTQKNGQWLMDGKLSHETEFKPVCGYSGDCRLQDATEQQVAEYKKLFPAEVAQQLDIKNTPTQCIVNIAFAFCRMEKNGNRAYFWVAPLYDKQKKPLAIPLYKQ